MRNPAICRGLFIIFMICGISNYSYSQTNIGRSVTIDSSVVKNIDHEVLKLMDEGKIPGLSLVIVSGDEQLIKTYGYANAEDRTPVSSHTLFQLGSCSKAFTALAVLKLVSTGSIRSDAYVSDYLPWFRATYKDSLVKISVLQLLHHTSGIPWQTISAIKAGNEPDALEKTIKGISGVSLHNLPGRKYEYSTINYDVLALIIEKVTNETFEAYVQDNVLNELKLVNTRIGQPADSHLLSTGYKIGFFKPRPYTAPVFKGNNAAGYVISDANDMGKWLQFQMGMTGSPLYPLAKLTQQRDETVALHDMDSYAMGWEVSLSGNKEIFHGGLNPNYTSYIAMRPEKRIGIVVLANSNSDFTPAIGNRIIKLLAGEEIKKEKEPGDGGDRVFSMISFMMGIFILVIVVFLGVIVKEIIARKRRYEQFSVTKLKKCLPVLILTLPFLYGVYILPKAIAGFSWDSIMVWTPESFAASIALLIAAIAVSCLAFLLGIFYPETNKFKKIAPGILLMSILSGLSNMMIIILLTSSQDNNFELKYLIFYFCLSLFLYLMTRGFFQKNLVRFTRGLIYELRIKLIDKIFSTTFQKFEKIDRGRVYTALNDDVDTIGESANMFVMLITSFITALGAFMYLAFIAFWATILTISLVVFLCALYYFVSKSSNIYYDQARDTRNVFMRLINGMIDGFKEISLHRNKKLEYKEDVAASANEYRAKTSVADIRFVNTFLVGESTLIVILGVVAFALPRLFSGIHTGSIMSFIIILLYLGGSINQIVSSVPAILRLKIAWKRIQAFLGEIPANLDIKKEPSPLDLPVEGIRSKGIKFRYKNKNQQEEFEIGPIDLEVKNGEILFIIGGNGSGKTTLAKLLTGLYEPDEGKIMINNKVVDSNQLSEYFSTVFNPSFLFEKLYNIDIKNKQPEIRKYLGILNLEDKVQIDQNKYNTIDLSGGQRKRLALLQCYLEDSPIYLFDEWAADQDPAYRSFFYRTLLPEMKKAGKIVIAITHDDHYFDIADKILKMKDGRLELYSEGYALSEIAPNGKEML